MAQEILFDGLSTPNTAATREEASKEKIKKMQGS